VPIALLFEEDTYALVITGPNTGGKTVSLKTAGLLVVMSQSGLHIPAKSGSGHSVFETVLADIGDEQSIEQSLSTFSGHIANITRIMVAAGPRALVLLDELGAGTDPQEGAALARAILEAFLIRRTTTLVATHFPELKTFAHATPGVRNASVEFDLESLRPTYHLTIGLPGRSNALAIARRLGLDPHVIERARALVAPQDLEADDLLDEIHAQREQARIARAEAEALRNQIEAERTELTARLGQIESERENILETSRLQAQDELKVFQAELEELRVALRRPADPLNSFAEVRAEVKRLESKVDADLRPDSEQEIYSPEDFQIGDRVTLRTLATDGEITAIDREQAEVQIGRLRVRAGWEELAPAREEFKTETHTSAGSAQSDRPRAVKGPKGKLQPLELNMRGMRVEEALVELERRLDAAFLAGMPFVRIVHGKGTGRLRVAIREALASSPYVDSYEAGAAAEGGEGVTIVHLSSR
jgi:DNA mismatch repair protein MutS2